MISGYSSHLFLFYDFVKKILLIEHHNYTKPSETQTFSEELSFTVEPYHTKMPLWHVLRSVWKPTKVDQFLRCQLEES